MDTEVDIKVEMDMERKRQALADFLHMDREAIMPCTVRVNDLNTFQVERKIYLMGRRRRSTEASAGTSRTTWGSWTQPS